MMNYIIEVANTHGGNIDYLYSLLEEFKRFEGHGIKFQPLHPEKIATPDFEWYPVYEKLYFNNKEWSEILNLAKETKVVWLDLFDTYGIEILKENIKIVSGIKLQASILFNQQIIDALCEIDISGLNLIINISAMDIDTIAERVKFFEEEIKPKELFLEVGFQSYPTKLQDSGLNKLNILKQNFQNRLVFADHIEGGLEDAIRLPLIASLLGANMIEKHVMHSNLQTEYDYFSAINHARYEELIASVEQYAALAEMEFINESEIDYLEKSIQIPILKKDLIKGEGIIFPDVFEFKRSGKRGLNVKEIKELINEKYILSENVEKTNPLRKENFKKAIIGTIIAGRLKSSRLKRKALLKIGELTSIELCIKNCLNFRNTNYTILATSDNNEDNELKEFTYSKSVLFHTGHPEDVIKRYLSIIDEKDIDVIIRVTADMPFVSSEITDLLLKSHFESGADYTAARNVAVGTAPEIINAKALREVKKHFPNAEYSEYMTWYFQNNAEYFRINIIDLPNSLIRDYRLTLDYQEDLELFNLIQNHLNKNKLDSNIKNIFNFMDSNPDSAKINSHLTLKYKTDEELINRLNDQTKIREK